MSPEEMPGYNPNSTDASFSRLFQRLDTQDESAKRIESKLDLYIAKTDSLEKERWVHRGMSASGFLAACHHIITRIGGA